MPFSPRLSLLFCATLLLLLHSFLPHQHHAGLAMPLSGPWSALPVQQMDLGEGHLEHWSLPQAQETEAEPVVKPERPKPSPFSFFHYFDYQAQMAWKAAQGNLPPPSLLCTVGPCLSQRAWASACLRRGPPVL